VPRNGHAGHGWVKTCGHGFEALGVADLEHPSVGQRVSHLPKHGQPAHNLTPATTAISASHEARRARKGAGPRRASGEGASVQDRDGAEALREARRSFPFIERVIGDAGYQGRKMAASMARTGTWALQIVRRCDRHRFVVLPKRWIVTRTPGWISRNRRLARDYERHTRKAAALVLPCHGDSVTIVGMRGVWDRTSDKAMYGTCSKGSQGAKSDLGLLLSSPV
jgi:putative transposase